MKHTLLNESLEALEIGTDDNPASTEQDVSEIMTDQEATLHMAQLDNEIDDGMEDIRRCTEVSAVLEELAEVAGTITEATPRELRLIELVGDMAAAGTDADPEEIIPTMESMLGLTISTEGIVDRAEKIWNYIRTLLEKTINRIVEYFRALFADNAKLIRALEAAQGKVKKAVEAKKKIEESFSVTLDARYGERLSFGGRTIVDGREAIKILTGISNAQDYFYHHYTGYLKSFAARYKGALSAFTLTKGEAVAAELIGTLTATNMPLLPGLKPDAPTALPGAYEVELKMPKELKTAKVEIVSNTSMYFDMVSRTGLVIKKSEKKVEGTKGSYKPLSFDDLSAALSLSLKLLQTTELFREHGLKDLFATQKDLEKATGDLGKRLDKEADKSASGNMGMRTYRSMANLNTTFASWIDDPVRAYCKYEQEIMRSMVHFLVHLVNTCA